MPHPDCNTAYTCPAGVSVYNGATKKWTINVDDGGAGGNVEGVAVSNFQVIGTTYCNTLVDHVAWGVTKSGTTFRCTLTGVTVDNVELLGTDGADDLCFDSANWFLQNVTTTSGSMTATMFGLGGADEMAGSLDDTNYAETLRGADGDDWIEGQLGADTCVGEAGADTIDGGWDNDSLSGGTGSDVIYGDLGNDLLCGNGGVDTLYGEDGDDILPAGGQFGDAVDGGLGANQCSGYTTITACAGSITSPFTCPL